MVLEIIVLTLNILVILWLFGMVCDRDRRLETVRQHRDALEARLNDARDAGIGFIPVAARERLEATRELTAMVVSTGGGGPWTRHRLGTCYAEDVPWLLDVIEVLMIGKALEQESNNGGEPVVVAGRSQDAPAGAGRAAR